MTVKEKSDRPFRKLAGINKQTDKKVLLLVPTVYNLMCFNKYLPCVISQLIKIRYSDITDRQFAYSSLAFPIYLIPIIATVCLSSIHIYYPLYLCSFLFVHILFRIIHPYLLGPPFSYTFIISRVHHLSGDMGLV